MRVARILGIDIYIDPSWLFIFVLVAWSLSTDVGPLHHADASSGERIVLGIVTALLFFASVLAHEMAHSLLARARGQSVSRITLFLFGGVSSLSSDFDSSAGEGWVAFVGPLASVLIAIIFYGIASALGMFTALGAAAGYLAMANGLLAIFNLLPAYPLDGGKVLHSIIWRATGDRRRATRTAAAIGRTIALGMIGVGIFMAFSLNFFSGLWFALIGWFLYQAGSAEAFQSELSESLRDRSAIDVATMSPPAFAPNDSVGAATEALLKSGQRAAPVADRGALVGLITLTDLARNHGGSSDAPIATLMTKAEKLTSVSPSTSAIDALRILGQSGFHQIPVVDAAGAVTGFITREAMLRRMTLSSGVTSAR